jgi:hypothetical protein
MRRFDPGSGRLIALSLIAALVALPVGCGQRQIELGTYRAALTLPGGELPLASSTANRAQPLRI